MIEDEAIVPEEPLEDEPELDADGVKKPVLPKDLIDEDTVSLEDEIEEEEEEDDEPFDDVNDQ